MLDTVAELDDRISRVEGVSRVENPAAYVVERNKLVLVQEAIRKILDVPVPVAFFISRKEIPRNRNGIKIQVNLFKGFQHSRCVPVRGKIGKDSGVLRPVSCERRQGHLLQCLSQLHEDHLSIKAIVARRN